MAVEVLEEAPQQVVLELEDIDHHLTVKLLVVEVLQKQLLILAVAQVILSLSEVVELKEIQEEIMELMVLILLL